MSGKLIGGAIALVLWPIVVVCLAGFILYKCRYRIAAFTENSV